jgi:hypothetical protein
MNDIFYGFAAKWHGNYKSEFHLVDGGSKGLLSVRLF